MSKRPTPAQIAAHDKAMKAKPAKASPPPKTVKVASTRGGQVGRGRS